MANISPTLREAPEVKIAKIEQYDDYAVSFNTYNLNSASVSADFINVIEDNGTVNIIDDSRDVTSYDLTALNPTGFLAISLTSPKFFVSRDNKLYCYTVTNINETNYDKEYNIHVYKMISDEYNTYVVGKGYDLYQLNLNVYLYVIDNTTTNIKSCTSLANYIVRDYDNTEITTRDLNLYPYVKKDIVTNENINLVNISIFCSADSTTDGYHFVESPFCIYQINTTTGSTTLVHGNVDNTLVRGVYCTDTDIFTITFPEGKTYDGAKWNLLPSDYYHTELVEGVPTTSPYGIIPLPYLNPSNDHYTYTTPNNTETRQLSIMYMNQSKQFISSQVFNTFNGSQVLTTPATAYYMTFFDYTNVSDIYLYHNTLSTDDSKTVSVPITYYLVCYQYTMNEYGQITTQPTPYNAHWLFTVNDAYNNSGNLYMSSGLTIKNNILAISFIGANIVNGIITNDKYDNGKLYYYTYDKTHATLGNPFFETLANSKFIGLINKTKLDSTAPMCYILTATTGVKFTYYDTETGQYYYTKIASPITRTSIEHEFEKGFFRSTDTEPACIRFYNSYTPNVVPEHTFNFITPELSYSADRLVVGYNTLMDISGNYGSARLYNCTHSDNTVVLNGTTSYIKGTYIKPLHFTNKIEFKLKLNSIITNGYIFDLGNINNTDNIKLYTPTASTNTLRLAMTGTLGTKTVDFTGLTLTTEHTYVLELVQSSGVHTGGIFTIKLYIDGTLNQTKSITFYNTGGTDWGDCGSFNYNVTRLYNYIGTLNSDTKTYLSGVLSSFKILGYNENTSDYTTIVNYDCTHNYCYNTNLFQQGTQFANIIYTNNKFYLLYQSNYLDNTTQHLIPLPYFNNYVESSSLYAPEYMSGYNIKFKKTLLKYGDVQLSIVINGIETIIGTDIDLSDITDSLIVHRLAYSSDGIILSDMTLKGYYYNTIQPQEGFYELDSNIGKSQLTNSNVNYIDYSGYVYSNDACSNNKLSTVNIVQISMSGFTHYMYSMYLKFMVNKKELTEGAIIGSFGNYNLKVINITQQQDGEFIYDLQFYYISTSSYSTNYEFSHIFKTRFKTGEVNTLAFTWVPNTDEETLLENPGTYIAYDQNEREIEYTGYETYSNSSYLPPWNGKPNVIIFNSVEFDSLCDWSLFTLAIGLTYLTKLECKEVAQEAVSYIKDNSILNKDNCSILYHVPHFTTWESAYDSSFVMENRGVFKNQDSIKCTFVSLGVPVDFVQKQTIRNYTDITLSRAWSDIGTVTLNLNPKLTDVSNINIGDYILLPELEQKTTNFIYGDTENDIIINDTWGKYYRQYIILYKRLQVQKDEDNIVYNMCVRGIEVKGLFSFSTIVPPGGTLLSTGQITYPYTDFEDLQTKFKDGIKYAKISNSPTTDFTTNLTTLRTKLLLYQTTMLDTPDDTTQTLVDAACVDLQRYITYMDNYLANNGTFVPAYNYVLDTTITGDTDGTSDSSIIYTNVPVTYAIFDLIYKTRSNNQIIPQQNIPMSWSMGNVNFGTLFDSTSWEGPLVSNSFRFKVLSTSLFELCSGTDYSWLLYTDVYNLKKGINIYNTRTIMPNTCMIVKGVNRSLNQQINNPVVLNFSTGDITGVTNTEDTLSTINQLISAGQGQGSARTIYFGGNKNAYGVNSKLGYKDCRNQSSLNSVISTTEAEIESLNQTTSIEVTVPASKLESMVDKTFYLGDIITVKLEEIGVIANYRVIQITERYFPSNSGTVQLTLGTLNYTVYDGIKYKLKNASVTSLL